MANKSQAVRKALGLTPTEAGKLLLGKTNAKSAYDQWVQWETGVRNPSKATENMFSIILILIKAKNHRTKNCHGALDLVLKTLKTDIKS